MHDVSVLNCPFCECVPNLERLCSQSCKAVTDMDMDSQMFAKRTPDQAPISQICICVYIYICKEIVPKSAHFQMCSFLQT